jgi:Na+/H+-dicarboxylate symporter
VSLTTRVLIALAAGVGIGLALSGFDPKLARSVAAVVEPAGTLFVNAIRMTVIPLVVSSLIVGMATSGAGGGLARMGARGVVIFFVLLTASAVVAAVVAPPVMSRVNVSASAVASLRASAATGSVTAGAAAMQSPAEWLVSLVPSNAFRAAADGAMLPLIVFALVLGLALGRLPGEQRDRVVTFFRAIANAMLVLVRWLLVVAPIGVFALALPLVARMGLSAVGALAAYIVLVSVAAIVFMLVVLYPIAVFGGRVSLREFARAAAPAQAVAISSRSSLAALPAMIEAASDDLQLPEEISSFFLPFASATFRVGATLGLTTGAVFIAHLYGITLTTPQLITAVLTSVLTSFSIPGIPGGSVIGMVPVLASVGLPIEGVGILLGVDTIPDMFRTTANVTGQLAAATVVAHSAPRREPSAVVA